MPKIPGIIVKWEGLPMHAIRKNIIADEASHPITSEEVKTADPSRFAGVISLTEDPLAYQLRIRGEWQ